MRHQQIADTQSYERIDIAAVWPAGTQVAPVPVVEPAEAFCAETFRATPAAPDVPAGVGRLIVGAYAGLIAMFALATVASAQSAFMVSISALFLVAFFTVPRLFLGQERKAARRPTLEQFLGEGLETLTGHCTGRDALIQMLIVPVFLTLAVAAMGIAVAVYM